ncbi:projectin protein bent isoform X2 [Brevipalpus obovatus]|uniref:projectin protein bent isoform X2 n=1 Tax=Brevipalpus obovatus TaxID=246614 RepID=UPI003D9E3D75
MGQIDGLPPTFAKKPGIRQEDDGQRLIFECKIQADPKPTISWFHNGSLVEATTRYKINIKKDIGGPANSYVATMEILDVRVEDAGKYKVIAKNELGESNASISLNFDSEDSSVLSDNAKPTFTEKPVIKQSDDGNKIVFECRLVADPAPTIEWYHKGKVVKEDTRHKYKLVSDKHNHIASLELSRVVPDDGGEYRLVAKNSSGEGFAHINLNFEGGKPKLPDGKAPRFPKKPTIRQVGGDLILECIVESNPKPEITWYHGAKVIREGVRHKAAIKEIERNTFALSLTINDPSNEDGGAYRCNATNELGESNANIALNFQGGDDEEDLSPSFVSKPKIIPKDGGSLILLECRIKSTTKISTTWSKGTTLVRESTRIKSSIISEGNDEYTVQLEIKSVSKEDGGIYKCNIKNSHGEINASLNLNIEGGDLLKAGEPPSFVDKPRIIPENNGKLIIMECRVRSKPKPDITWYNDGKIVRESSSRIKMSMIEEKTDIYLIRLELRDPELTDAGLYKCNVKNPAGESNANLTLNIELAPVIKEKPKVIKQIREKKIIIEVRVASAGKPNVQWIKESTTVREDSRRRVKIQEITKGEYSIALEIDRVEKLDKGVYKLVAKNEKGECTSQSVTVDVDDMEEKQEKKKEEEEKKTTLEKKRKEEEEKSSIEKRRKEEEEKKTSSIEKKSREEEKSSIDKKSTLEEKKEERKSSILEKKDSSKTLEEKKEKKTLSTTEKRKKEEEKKKSEESQEDLLKKKRVEELKSRSGGKVDKPFFVSQIKSFTIEEGKSADLKCVFMSKVPVQVTWYFEKNVIQEDSHMSMSQDDKSACLSINDARHEDSGEYMVRVANSAGEVDSIGILTVKALLTKKEPTKREKTKPEEEESPKKLKTRQEEPMEVDGAKKKLEKQSSIPEIQIEKERSPARPRKGSEDQENIEPTRKRPSIPIVKEPTPEPEPKLGGRRGSFIDATGQQQLRRGSFIDVEEMKNLRTSPRRTSQDARRPSIAEFDPTEKPSTALHTKGKEAKIVNYAENQQGTEGKTAYIQFDVEGDPVPTFRFFKDGQEIYEGGRYVIVTDGSSNTVWFCVKKAKSADEGRYTVMATNTHGESTAEIGLFIGGEEGMDFRAMLKRGKRQQWRKQSDDPDWGNLKAVEDERRASLKESKKPEIFTKPLQNQKCKEGRDKKVRFECVFSKVGVKPKWYKNKQELFMGRKNHMTSQGDLHVLEIINPTVEDEGKYVCKCLDTTTEAFLDVAPPDPVYKFVKKLPSQSKGYTDRECVLECSCNSAKAPVKWYKGDKKLENSDKYIIEQDGLGKKFLRIQNCTLDDAAEYTCRINQEEFTTTKLSMQEQAFKFMRVLRSMRVNESDTITLECEVDDWEAPVQWSFNGQDIKKDKHYDIQVDNRKRRLVIKKCKLADEGKYLARTKGDETESEVLVEPANRFKKKLADVHTIEKKQVVFEVEMSDNRQPLKWYKDGQEIHPGDRYHVRFHDEKYTLTIDNVKLEDAGEIMAATPNIKTKCRLMVDEAERAPIIKMEDKDFQSDVGKPFAIEVPYSVPGTRTSDVIAKLLRNGKPVPKSEVDVSIRQEKIVFTFKKTNRDNSDQYQISIGNAEGEAKKDVKVNFVGPPAQPEGPLAVSDLFRDRCKLAWKPPKDDGGMPIKHYVIERQALSARGGWQEIGTTEACNFNCTDLEYKKEYKFRVRAVNKKGASEPLESAKNILAKDPYDEPSKPFPPEIVDWDKDHVDLKWKPPEKDGGSPITDYQIEFKDKFSPDWTKGPKVPGDQNHCRVKNLKENMAYQFRLIALNKAGPSEPSDPTKPHQVKARFVKPYIIGDGPRPMVVKKGQVIKYDIQFFGEPPPTVTWELNGQELFAGSKLSIDNTAKTTLLQNKNAVRADSGKYKLTLTNSSGTCSAEADVVVLDKPTPPEGPLVLEEVRADHCIVKWRKPKDTGGSDIQGYLIEKMDMDTGKWTKAGETGPDADNFRIDGLSPKKRYKFRVRAINKEGVSDPLETTDIITAKNPYDEPSKPGKPEIVDYDNTKVDLKWTTPEKDGGRPITHYVVEMKDKFGSDWVEVLKTPDANPQATVANLKEGNTVQFRVRAVNKAGPSEPSDATEPHIVKHKNLKPKIDRTNLKNITIKAGRGVKFPVDVIGEPPPTVKWTFGEAGQPVSSDDHYKIVNKDYHSDFDLTKAQRIHSGIYTITATNASGSDSATVEIKVLSKPGKPEGPLDVHDVHKEGCKLSWKKPKDDGGLPIKGYEVEKLDKESGRWTRCGKTDKTDFEVAGLIPGKEYLFRVAAINDEGDSEPLETLHSIIAKNPYDEPGKPGTPEIVDYDNKSVDLKWTPPKSDGGAPIEKYIVERKEKFQIMWEKACEVPGKSCEAKVDGLTERAEVQFRIIAVNKAGPGEPSDATGVHVVKHRKLKPRIDRTNLETVTIKKGKSIKLDVNVSGEPPPKITWHFADKEVKPNDHYQINNVDYNTKFGIEDAQRIHSGKYKIVAVNEHGRDEAEVEIVVLAAPNRPKGPLKVNNVHNKGCKLGWEKPEDDGGKPIQGYIVEKLDLAAGGWVPIGRTDETNFEVTGLTPGKRYQFRIKAVNAEGQSEPLVSDEPTLAKNPYDEPGAPENVEIDDYDEKHVKLKWKVPKDDGGAPITGYIIEKKEKLGSWEPCAEVSGSKPEGKVEGLTKGQVYQFRVRAVNKAGPGEASEPTKSHLCKERFLAPKINRDSLQPLRIKAGNMGRFDVEVIGEPPPTITWEFAGRPLEETGDIKFDNKDYETHVQMKNMTRAQSGKYKIIAVNSSGKDEAEVEVTVLDRPSKPEGPLEVSNVHAEGCNLDWLPPKDDGGVPIEAYLVEKQDAATGRWVPVTRVPGDKTGCAVAGLEPGKRYNFRIKALNNEGESDALETDRSTLAKNPYDAAGPPGLPKIDDYDKDFVVLKWDAPLRDGGAPITGYLIEKKSKFSPDWVTATETTGPACTGKVANLTEGDKYEFRVRAINKAGPGAPSESTGPHLMKPRFLKPQIDRTNLKSITVKAGQMVNFDVNVIGEPPPKTVWYFGETPLTDGAQFQINDVDYNTKFALLRATRAENGTYKLVASNEVGSDEAEVVITVLAKPSAPEGPLQISDVHKEGCKLKWKPPKDDGGCPIECYEIEKMDEETGRWVPAGRSTDTSYEVSNLVPGKRYKFRIRAVNKEGDSDELEAEQAITAKNPFDEPSIPGRPEPTDWDVDHVDLTWKPPMTDGGSPITGYRIEKRKKGTHKWVKGANINGNVAQGTCPDLEEGEEYEFRIVALNKAGESEPSEPSRFVAAKPRKLAPIIDRTSLKPITIRAGQPIKFDVDVRGEPPPTISWSFKDEPLQPSETITIENEPYHTLLMMTKTKRPQTGTYKITAKNEHGTDEATVEVKVLSKPGKPKGPLDVSDVHAEGCKLKWDKPEDDGGEPIQQYVVEKLDLESGRWVPVTTSRDTEAEITGLIPGKEYKFRVKAVNAEGESEPLETEKPTLAKNPFDEPDKPGKPKVANWDKNFVDLTWDAPASDGGAPITGYIVEKKDRYSNKWIKALETKGPECEAHVPDLIEGMEYQFRVKAVNKAGPSQPSEPSNMVTAKPRNLAPKIDRTNLRDLTIHAGQNVKFDVKVIGEPTPTVTWIGNDGPIKDGPHVHIESEPNRSKFAIQGATRKDTGVYTIKAENVNGKDEAEVQITVLDKPDAPEGPLEVDDVHAEGCKLKWKKPKDDGGVPIECYQVEKMDTATGKWIPCGKAYEPQFEVQNLEPGKEYKFRVKAINAEGESAPLETEQGTLAKNPYDAPGAPGTPQVTDVDRNHVDLKWDAPVKDGGAPITGYLIEKKSADGTKWVKAAQIDGPVTEARVPDLENGETYQFRVKAINAGGIGEPSDATKPVTCKPSKLPPRIDRKNLRPVSIKVGQNFGFDVNVQGEPAPTIQWFIKDRELESAPDLTIVNKPYHTKLSCDKASRKDAAVYRIVAKNKYGVDEADVTVEVVGKPSKPEGPLDVSDVNKNGCKLAWNKPKDDGGEPLDGYLVEKLDPDTGSWIPIGKTMIPEMTVTGLVPGKDYSFRVKAVNKEGESEPLQTLAPITAKDPFSEPGQPGTPEVTAFSPDSIDVKWEPPARDGGAPITGYIIEKKEKGKDWEKGAEVFGPTTKAKVANLKPGKEYEFRVVAVNKAGPSEPSLPSHPQVAKNPFDEPGAPGRPEPTDWDKDHVDLKWTAPENDGGAPITGYIIEKRKKGARKWDKAATVPGTATSGTAPDLEEGQEYEFRVLAVNKAGPGEPSEPSRSVIAKPRKLAPRIDRTNLKPITIKAGQPVKFDVDVRGEPPPKITWAFRDAPLIPLENLTIETEPYHTLLMMVKTTREQHGTYTITAKNEHGMDEASVEVNIVGKPSSPKGPLDVSDVHAEGCKLAWKKPEDDGGSPILHYLIEKQDPEKGTWVPAGTSRDTEASVKGLTPGKMYKFRVRAVNAEGESEPLESEKPIEAKNPYDEPGKPGKPTVKNYDRSGRNNCYVDLVWNPPETDGGAPITGYVVEKKEKGSSKWQKACETIGDKCEVRVPNLVENTDYQFRVKAVNKAGPGGPSDASDSVTAKARNVPPTIEPIKDITLHAGKHLKIDLKISGEPPPRVEWFLNGSPLSSGGRTTIETPPYRSKFSVPNAERCDAGTYRIVATNVNGKDELEVRVNVLDKPGPPEGPLEVKDVHAEGCKLKWNPPKDDGGTPIECYQVEKMDTATGKWVPCGKAYEPQFEVQNLEPGHEYKFRVKAINAEGESEPLETDHGTVAKNPYDTPGAPGQPQVVDYDKHHVDLKWTAPTRDGGAPITGYVIERKAADSGRWVKALETRGPLTEVRVPDLQKNETYQFRVRAVNAGGQGEASEPCKPVTCKPRKLAPRIDRKNLKPIQIKAGDSFSFDVGVQGEPPPDVQWLIKESPVRETSDLTITNKPYRTKLNCDKAERKDSATYRIVAKNPYGMDEADVEVTVISKPSKPEGPLDVSDVSKEGCKLAWKKPKDDGGLPLDGYLVEKLDPDTGSWVPIGKTLLPEMDVTGLKQGKDYQFRVKALNKEGESEPLQTMAPITAKDPFSAPGQPGKPEVLDWNRDRVELAWEAPRTDGGAPITHYTIQKREKGDFKWTDAVEIPGMLTKGTVPFLSEGKEYEFRVVANNKAGPGEPSLPSNSVVTKPRFLPPQIDRKNLRDLKVNAGSTIRFNADVIGEPPPTITWTLNDATIKGDEHFNLENVDYNTKLIVRNVKRGDSGKYVVTAVNSSGKDAVTLQVTVIDVPSPPEGPIEVSNITRDGCRLKWRKPKDDGGSKIIGYVVEKRQKGAKEFEACNDVPHPDTNMFVGGLKEGEEYEFRVVAVNEMGESPPSNSTPMTKIQPEPDRPRIDVSGVKDIVVKAGQEFSINIPYVGYPKPTAHWSNEDKPIDEDDKRFMSKVGDDYALLACSSAKREDAGRYTVTLKNPCGGDSVSLNVKVLDRPSPPQNVRGEDVDGDSLTLLWKPPKDDGGAEITNYVVERREVGSPNWQRISSFATSTALRVKNLTIGKKYDFRVMAENQYGTSDPCQTSEPILARLPFDPPSAPGTPRSLDTSPESITLGWTKPRSDGGSPIIGYIVEKRKVGESGWTRVTANTVPDLNYRVPGLKENNEYEFRVAAVNAAGQGPFSDVSDGIFARHPSAPPKIDGGFRLRDLVVMAGEQFTLRVPFNGYPLPKAEWLVNGNVVIPDERVYSEVNVAFTILTNSKAKRTDSGSYTLRLTNSEGTDSCSCRVQVVDKPGPPQGPLDVSDITPETCTLSWRPPLDDGGSPITNYVIEKQDPVTKIWTKLSSFCRTCHYNVMGLELGKKYNFRVCAENQYGTSIPLETDGPITAKFPFDVPDPPSKPSITDFGPNEVSLSWDKPVHDGGSKIQGYQVEYRDAMDGRWLVCVPFCRETYTTATGLIENRDYEFRVKAKNAAGYSKPSESSGNVKTRPKFSVPSPPRNLHVTKVGKSYVDLKWEKPRSDGGSKLIGYVIERKDVNSSYWIKVNDYGALDCEYTVLNLIENNEYEFQVSAVNSAGKSEPCRMSGPVKITDIADGKKPEFVRKLFNKSTSLKGTLRFECEAIGKPIPKARWLKNGREVLPGPRIRAIDDGDGVYRLVIDEVQDIDEGDYTCEVTNPLGTDRCSASLKIASPPAILRCPDQVYFPENDNGKIKIYFSGSSPFEVTLYKDGLEVSENDHLKVTLFDDYAIVFIRDVVKTDQGKYKMVVKNDSGQADASFTLYVTGLPGPPQGPLATSDVTQHSVALAWRPPTFDGGCKVTHYIVERKETSHTQWITVSSLCRDTSTVVQGLTTNGEYLFRVMAVNENGQSIPLVGDKPIIAKLPFDPPAAPGTPNVTEVGGDFVNLSWDKPSSDGGSRILGYVIEKRETGSTSWQPVNPNSLCHATQINISNLIEDRNYEFRVFAVNEAGLSPPSEASRSVKIKDPQAATPPEFITPLKTVMAVENKSAQFTCTVTGVPTPTITWYKGAREIHDGGKYAILRDGESYILSISNVFGEDADEYACRATNKAGSRSSRAELLIKTPPKLHVPPRFKDMACFDRGENVAIKIPFTGYPKPKIRWSKEGEEIESGGHFDVQVHERHAVLIIRDASRLDNGPYCIKADNELGTDSAIIKVSISDRPDPPRMLTIETVGDDFLTLSWKPPTWDGGSSITNYVIEKKEPSMSTWVRCANTRFTLHQVTNLSSGKEYEFRVFAENIYGRSEPSEITPPVKTKPSDKDKSKKKHWMTDAQGRKYRGKDEGKIFNYDQFVTDDIKSQGPVDIKTSSVYDYYDILEEIGTGAFGVVHRCREKKTGQIFAAKFIPVAHPYEKSLIRKEIDIMNQLHNHKLIRLHDAFEDDDEMILIYEFMSGGELFERITDEGYHMSEQEVVNYMRQICEGVKHMHEKNIIHLDLKPENIMCQKKNSTNVKIIDFGLATKLDPNEVVKISTGTAEFAAPEIVEREPVGFYTDMWAVGVLAYVLLSGLSPFGGENEIETLKNVKACDWEFDEEAFRNISSEAKDFIKKLLTRNKEKRLTAHECLEHSWLKTPSTATTQIPNRKYIPIRDRIRAKYGDFWWSVLVPIGHISNYSSLRKLQEERYKIHETYVDRREMAPRFVVRPQSTFAYEGQAAKFLCRVIAAAPATVTWYHDSGELKQSVKYMKRYQEGDYTFVINRCKTEDRGEYIIRAENHYGWREEPVFLNVQPKPLDMPQVRLDEPKLRRREPPVPVWLDEPDSGPLFTFHLRPRVIQCGIGVKLLACLTGKPTPEIRWFKDGRELSKYDYTVSHAAGVVTLDIPSCTMEDAGKYTVTATNSLGEAESTATVIIESKKLGPRPGEPVVTGPKPTAAPKTPSPITPMGAFIQGDSHFGVYRDSSGRLSTSYANTTSTSSTSSYNKKDYSSSSYQSSSTVKKQSSYSSSNDYSSKYSSSKLSSSKISSNYDSERKSSLTSNYSSKLDHKSDSILDSKRDYRSSNYLSDTKSTPKTGLSPQSSLDVPASPRLSPSPPSPDSPKRSPKKYGETGSGEISPSRTRTKDLTLPDEAECSPEFVDKLHDLTIKDGESLLLKCHVKAVPEAQIEWTKNGEVLRSSDIIDLKYKNGTASLAIAEVFPEDEGDYLCKATNSQGTGETKCKLTVIPMPHLADGSKPISSKGSPRIVKHVEGLVAKDGDKNVTLRATIKGQTKFEVVWLHNDKEIKLSKDFVAKNEGDDYLLVITEVYPEDAGIYTCEAFNDAGEAFSSCTLHVIVPEEEQKGPEIAKFPLSMTAALGKSVAFTIESKNAVKKVEWLQDLKPIDATSSHHQFKNEGDKKFTLTIPSTAISDIGQYTVKLTDDTGEISAAFSLNVLSEDDI